MSAEPEQPPEKVQWQHGKPGIWTVIMVQKHRATYCSLIRSATRGHMKQSRIKKCCPLDCGPLYVAELKRDKSQGEYVQMARMPDHSGSSYGLPQATVGCCGCLLIILVSILLRLIFGGS